MRGGDDWAPSSKVKNLDGLGWPRHIHKSEGFGDLGGQALGPVPKLSPVLEVDSQGSDAFLNACLLEAVIKSAASAACPTAWELHACDCQDDILASRWRPAGGAAMQLPSPLGAGLQVSSCSLVSTLSNPFLEPAA